MDSKFVPWGVRIRRDPARNYYSLWRDLVTIRLDLGEEQKLDIYRPEFVDCCIGTACNGMCDFCYVNAGPMGENWEGICETWKRWMATIPEDTLVTDDNMDEVTHELVHGKLRKKEDPRGNLLKVGIRNSWKKGEKFWITEKPFQIAIGGTGEPTIHPEFCDFLRTVYESGVVPNYTTNGMMLSQRPKELMEATRDYCGGVAVSFGNKHLRDYATGAIAALTDMCPGVRIVIHHLIKDKVSVDEAFDVISEYRDSGIWCHVFLPLMKHGRCTEGMEDDGTYEYLAEKINDWPGEQKFALGANFLPFMKKHQGKLKIWEYPSEIYSENVMLRGGQVIITPSSYNLTEIGRV